MNILKFDFKQRNAQRKLSIIKPFFRYPEKILDFGCGDLLFDENLLKFNPKLKISGVDVVDFSYRSKGIDFYIYDGKKLPFKDKTFDAVLIFHVLHHCGDPMASLQECVRVTKKRVILIEPVYRNSVEIPIMRFMDWLYNFWKAKSIDMNYHFFSFSQWKEVFTKNNLSLRKIVDIDQYPKWVPFGRAYVFCLDIK